MFAALAAGVTRVPWRRFVVYNAAGAAAWGMAMAVLGYAFGQSWKLLETWVGKAGLVLVALVAAALVFAALRNRRARVVAWIKDHLPGDLTLYEAWLIAASLVAIGLAGKITEDVVTRGSTPFDNAVANWIGSIHVRGFHTL